MAAAATASEGTGALDIAGELREDERFGEDFKGDPVVYRHEMVQGISFPPGLKGETQELFLREWPEQARADDIYVVTFPKSGTTWTQQVLHLLKNRGEQGDVPIIRAMPWIERVYAAEKEGAAAMLDALESPRVFKSHSPRQIFPDLPAGTGKYIVVARNPKDTMVSMFYHAASKVEFEFNGDWNSWYRVFLAGMCESGDWFDYTLGWWQYAQENPDRALFFTYEQMKRDPLATVKLIAEFSGFECDDALAELITEKSSFKKMKANPMTNCEQIPQKGQPHLRKGEIGDWRNHFTVAQNAAFDELIEERLGGTGLEFEYLPAEEIDGTA